MSDNGTSKYQHWNDLAAKAQRGDKRAYQVLIKELVVYMRIALSGRLANADWIDDVIQDALISIHKALPTYQKGRSFKAWANSILYYRKTDFLRKFYAQKQPETSSYEAMIEKKHDGDVTNLVNKAEYTDIEKALDGLPANQREVFLLSRIEGYTAKEIANMKDMSVSAVKVSVHRTTKKLKGLLE